MNAFNGLAMGGVADFNPWGSVIALFANGVVMAENVHPF